MKVVKFGLGIIDPVEMYTCFMFDVKRSELQYFFDEYNALRI